MRSFLVSKMPTTVYVLLCENDRYYIGKTDRPLEDRVEEHFNYCGSEWTRKYKPMKVIETKQFADEFDEDKYTKMYMKKFGIDKVRGGTYTQIELPEYSKQALAQELCSASDLCFRCNRQGHFASKCYAKTKADGTPIITKENSKDEELSSLISEGVTAISNLFSSIPIHKIIHMDDGNTKLEMSAFAITKIREAKKEKIQLDDSIYKIITTKRDLGLFAGSKNNYIIVEGKHNIVSKSYTLTMH